MTVTHEQEELREAIARIIEPIAFDPFYEHAGKSNRASIALAKAGRILALISPTNQHSKGGCR